MHHILDIFDTDWPWMALDDLEVSKLFWVHTVNEFDVTVIEHDWRFFSEDHYQEPILGRGHYSIPWLKPK